MTNIDSATQIVNRLTNTWRRFDADPPLELLEQIAKTCDVQIAERAIAEVGRAGRLAEYEPHFGRFVALRAQASRLRAEGA